MGIKIIDIVTASILFLLTIEIKTILAKDNVASIDEYKYENNGDGTYSFRFVTSDGTEREESGKLEGEGNYVVRGYYSFLAPEGTKHYVNYVADNTGYHPTIGDSPVVTPIKHFELEPPIITQALSQAVVASLLG